ncbi:hypothetical protein [Dysgonomonas termitidis]|uniref:Uncharacterized protein n=1 Tax=Dysgonomonas termitidis TaxID=1516126 RepID=A0ABV9KZX7_9BACT
MRFAKTTKNSFYYYKEGKRFDSGNASEYSEYEMPAATCQP